MPEDKPSYLKQILAAVVIALVAGGTAPWWWTALFDDPNDPRAPGGNGNGQVTIPDGRFLPCDDPSISLSRGTGPSGTHVVVRGTGFPSDEAVEVRFHTEALPPARTDDEGSFRDEVVIPGTFDAFAPQQFEIRVTTKPTICSASAPFALTA